MTSTLKLYKNVNLSDDRNFYIDSISDYLGDPAVTITDFQYVKIGLFISIKIDTSQNYLAMNDNTYNYNYIVINNGSDYRFFVMNKKWISQNTIQYDLKMDVLNTFRWNTSYTPTARTLVTREHKDRFKSSPALSYDITIAFISEIFVADESKTLVDNSHILYGVIANRCVSNYSGSVTCVSLTPELNITSFTITGIGIFRITFKNTSGSTYSGVVRARVRLSSPYKLRDINLRTEGINPILYKNNEEIIRDSVYANDGKDDTAWLLHYKNTNAIDPDSYNEVNPVECHLLNKDPITISVPGNGDDIRSDISTDGSYYFSPIYNQGVIEVDGSTEYEIKLDGDDMYYVVIYKNGTSYVVRYYHFVAGDPFGGAVILVDYVSSTSSIKFVNSPSVLPIYYVSGSPSGVYDLVEQYLNNTNDSLYPNTEDTVYMLGEGNIDRTDSKNIKIIELPYAPTSLGRDSQDIPEIGSYWEYNAVGQYFKLSDPNTKFVNEFISTVSNPMYDLLVEIPTINGAENRDDFYESKLFHSDFYQPKFVYDSFSLTMMMEQVNGSNMLYQNGSQEHLKVKFVTSTNIMSKFCFILPQYTLNHSVSDYDNVINVSRNNEQVLYTSQYINYLRTGYNYDLKSKQRTETASGVGIGLSALSIGASIIGGVISGNVGVAVGGAVAGAISLSNQLVNYAKSVAQNEDAIARKLQEAKNQAVTVAGADDIDLLNAYSGNRAKMCYYTVSDEMKHALGDLFYYCGYSTYEQKIPVINSRLWFNYLQCELEITGTNYNLTEELILELKNKFKDGVTFFHKNGGTWNVEQTLENWEVSLL